jgi:hypothetical protein
MRPMPRSIAKRVQCREVGRQQLGGKPVAQGDPEKFGTLAIEGEVLPPGLQVAGVRLQQVTTRLLDGGRKPQRVKPPVGTRLDHGGTRLDVWQHVQEGPLLLGFVHPAVADEEVHYARPVVAEGPDLEPVVHGDARTAERPRLIVARDVVVVRAGQDIGNPFLPVAVNLPDRTRRMPGAAQQDFRHHHPPSQPDALAERINMIPAKPMPAGDQRVNGPGQDPAWNGRTDRGADFFDHRHSYRPLCSLFGFAAYRRRSELRSPREAACRMVSVNRPIKPRPAKAESRRILPTYDALMSGWR